MLGEKIMGIRAANMAIMAALVVLAAPASAKAQIAAPVTSLLGKASDSALDQLAQPGTFYNDQAVRILLPGPFKQAAKLMAITDKVGLTDKLTRGINDAAGMAAGEAKPIFRNAINTMSLSDGVGIVSQGDGATRYLRDSSTDALRGKMRPLILAALERTGVFGQLTKLGKNASLLRMAGIDREGLTDSVTDQAMGGIFTYIGSEERKLRADPLSAGRSILQGLGKK